MIFEEVNEKFTLVTHPTQEIIHLPNFAESVRRGLSAPVNEKNLPCRFFYDEVGSLIFEEITKLEEYYPTKCEFAILQEKSEEIAKRCTPDTLLVELGSGSSTKTRILVEAFLSLYGKVHYVPIDISGTILRSSSEALLENYPNLTITACNGLYQEGLKYVNHQFPNQPKMVMFLGGSIGNFNREEEVEFLSELQLCLSPTDTILIGIDLRKDKEILEAAYDDKLGVTARFNLNLLHRINKELGGHFDDKNFLHVAEYLVEEGTIQMRLRSQVDQKVKIDQLKMEVQFAAGETIHTENSYKFSFYEIDHLANSCKMQVLDQWVDPTGKFTLSLFGMQPEISAVNVMNRLQSAWACSDRILSLIKPEGLLEHPISLRRPFIFYFGHLVAFAHNQICNCILKTRSFDPYFDTLFERGIDPIVDSPDKCHDHSEVPDKWPSIHSINSYRTMVREIIPLVLSQVLSKIGNVMAQKGRVFEMVGEHDLMHAETLLYMFHNLDPAFKIRPPDGVVNYCFLTSVKKENMITIPSGTARIGTQFHRIPWGWDNEFPEQIVQVPAFLIDRFPVTNGQFLEFVESGQYNNSLNWTSKDWKWKTSCGLNFPHTWQKNGSRFMYRTVFDVLPLDMVLNWPVYVSQAEASAYCKWKGKKLPTEPQFLRAAYGCSGDPNGWKDYPWGSADPQSGIHGNFNLFSWSPTPVGFFPKGKSDFGVYELIGNGWEWTSTIFEGNPGFKAYLPDYPGYSQDFFDGEHFVMLGASWATESRLIRRSFRNWFQPNYQFTFSKFRCVS